MQPSSSSIAAPLNLRNTGFCEPSAPGSGGISVQLEDAARSLGSIGSRVVLALDHYEVLKLLDSWLRQSFIPRLPSRRV